MKGRATIMLTVHGYGLTASSSKDLREKAGPDWRVNETVENILRRGRYILALKSGKLARQ